MCVHSLVSNGAIYRNRMLLSFSRRGAGLDHHSVHNALGQWLIMLNALITKGREVQRLVFAQADKLSDGTAGRWSVLDTVPENPEATNRFEMPGMGPMTAL